MGSPIRSQITIMKRKSQKDTTHTSCTGFEFPRAIIITFNERTNKYTFTMILFRTLAYLHIMAFFTVNVKPNERRMQCVPNMSSECKVALDFKVDLSVKAGTPANVSNTLSTPATPPMITSDLISSLELEPQQCACAPNSDRKCCHKAYLMSDRDPLTI